MAADRLGELERLFEQAAALPPAERDAFIDGQTDDPALARELRSLLASHDRAGAFLEPPGGGAADSANASVIGQMAGPYRIQRRIGEGGMSEVYLAVRADDEFKRSVALKVIRDRPDREDVVRRFRTERQILAGLDHPNIARLLDGGSLADGRPYFVMEYIEGLPIDVYCDQHRLGVDERLELFRTVCEAVQVAHRNLVVHRDIKSSNILVSSDGVPKLLDFGIAKLLRPDAFAEEVERTRTSHRPMTPRWASPEQIRGHTVTTGSDVYSLGVLLYRLLTGHFPFREEAARTPSDLARMILDEEPERPSQSIERTDTRPRPDGTTDEITVDSVSRSRNLAPAQLRRRLTGELDNIVLMALRKEPHRRYATVEQFSEDVRRYLNGLPVSARPDTWGYRVRKFTQRHRWPVAAGVVVAVAVAASAVFFAAQSARLAQQRDEARRERDRAETVLGLMETVFQVADPEEARGRELTAREILDNGARQVRRELRDQPIARASLMRTIGNVYANLGYYDEAIPLLEETLDIRRSVYARSSPPVTESMHDLGKILRKAGEHDRAEDLLGQALDLRAARDGPDSPGALTVELDLAILDKDRGDLKAAAERLRGLIARAESAGEDSETLASAMAYLAITSAEAGDFDEGERLFLEVIALRRRLNGVDHPAYAEALGDLGVVYGIQGRLEESRELMIESLERRRRVLDDDHPAIAESLNNLGRVHKELREFEEAEDCYRQSLSIYRRRLGDVDERVATAAANLSLLLLQTDDLDEAERLGLEALSIRRQVLEPDAQNTGASLTNVGEILIRQGRPAEAEPYLRESIQTLTAAVGEEHWRTSLARVHLGRCRAAAGDDREAERLMRRGLDGLLASLGPDHRRTSLARSILSEFLESRGRTLDG